MGHILFFLSATPGHRCGIIVSRRIGGAVVRNRLRRRIKEIIKLVLKNWHQNKGVWVIFVAKKGIIRVSFEEMCKEISAFMQNALQRVVQERDVS